MQKIICKRVYDTETATLVKSRCFGSFGDPAGYEEKLFLTPEGYYFVYGVGGEASPYSEPSIKQLAKAKAQSWE